MPVKVRSGDALLELAERYSVPYYRVLQAAAVWESWKLRPNAPVPYLVLSVEPFLMALGRPSRARFALEIGLKSEAYAPSRESLRRGISIATAERWCDNARLTPFEVWGERYLAACAVQDGVVDRDKHAEAKRKLAARRRAKEAVA